MIVGYQNGIYTADIKCFAVMLYWQVKVIDRKTYANTDKGIKNTI